MMRDLWVDQLWQPFSLTIKNYGLTGRQYHGIINHHSAAIFYQNVNRQPLLEIIVGTSLQTRLYLHAKKYQPFGLQKYVQKKYSDFWEEDEFLIGTIDKNWTQKLISLPEIKKIFTDLLNNKIFIRNKIELQPGYFILSFHNSYDIKELAEKPQLAIEWLKNLITLISQAEKILPPTINSSLTKSEKIKINNREDIQKKIFLIIFCAVFGLFGLIIILTIIFLKIGIIDS